MIAGARIDLLDALELLERDRPEVATAVAFRDLSQLSYAEIAKQQRIPLGTAKSRVNQGRQFIREYLMDPRPR